MKSSAISVVWKLLPLFILVLLFCNGCWDKKEFNQLAIAQTIAIDYAEEQYTMTVQLVMPRASDEEISGDSMWLISGKGDSVAEALEQISYTAPRELYLDHLDVVLLGEGVLQHSVGQGLEYLVKEHVLRRRTSLLAVEGSAGDLLQAKLKLADVDTYYLLNLLRDQRKFVKNGDTIINDYNLAMDEHLPEGVVVPRIIVKDEKALALNGAALLQDDRLLRWMNQQWLGSYRWITGGVQIYTLPANEYHDNLTVEVRKERCKWELVSEEPLRVRANLQGSLQVVENTMQARNRLLEKTEAFPQQVQQEMNQLLKAQTQKDFALLQQAGCDALKLGRWLQAWHPQLVQSNSWPEQFATMEIEVQMQTKIKSCE